MTVNLTLSVSKMQNDEIELTCSIFPEIRKFKLRTNEQGITLKHYLKDRPTQGRKSQYKPDLTRCASLHDVVRGKHRTFYGFCKK